MKAKRVWSCRAWVSVDSFAKLELVALEFDPKNYFGYLFQVKEDNHKHQVLLLNEEPPSEPTTALTLHEASLRKAYPIFTPESLALANSVSDYYFAPLSETIAAMLPPLVANLPQISPEVSSRHLPQLPLNALQEKIVQKICDTPASATSEHLIWGVTGSGKTRIYEHLISDALERSTQVLFLVPEIALSGQVMQNIAARFPNEVVLYHSGLTSVERASAAHEFLSGTKRIVVGTRSAVFLASKHLSLILIDEEHDTSFKDQRALRFDTRRVARLRQKTQKEPLKLVLGSATPSLESLARVKHGEAMLHRLRHRATGQELPQVFVPEYHTAHGIIAPFLMEKIHQHLENKKQVLLLMNRRGHSTHVYCPTCEKYTECPHCSVSLTYHKDNVLRCHYCGYAEDFTQRCPQDGTRRELSGRGIQKVEEILEARFPFAEYARLDRDTTRQKGFAQDVLTSLKERKIDILIGTQMIAKGLDFEGITLVGVLAIDSLLNAPDFRASEQAWQLLAQVVGRSGRHSPGEVVIQTMEPQNTAVQAAKEHNDDAFYAYEAVNRKLTHYPPFSQLARILIECKTEEDAIRTAEALQKILEPINSRELFGKEANESVELLGPAYPSLKKLENVFRVHFLIKSPDEKALSDYLARVWPLVLRLTRNGPHTRALLDRDPRNLS